MKRAYNSIKVATVINTSSLPDIVFLMLFFFMVTAVIKEDTEHLDAKIPEAVSITKAQQKVLVKELIIGYPKDKLLGKEPRIYNGEKIVSINQIPQWVEQKRNELAEHHRDQMIVMIRADEEIEMGLISDIQQELRKMNARKILYKSKEETTSSSHLQ
ncbi:MAG: biopolymer transporter ExbD [Cyclobacteriaceae bacterium]